MVHGLIGHASSDGSISNHRHTVIFPALHTRYASWKGLQSKVLLTVSHRDAGQDARLGRECCTLKSRATAMPRAAEMEVDECPAPKGSYSLSSLFVKPAKHYTRINESTGGQAPDVSQ